MSLAASVYADDVPSPTTAQIHFSGRIIESPCSIAVGPSSMNVRLDTFGKCVPVDLTLHDCNRAKTPSVRVLEDPQTPEQHALHTNLSDVVVELFEDAQGKKALCMDEDLLCGTEYLMKAHEQTYRTMWVNVEQRPKTNQQITANLNVVVQYD